MANVRHSNEAIVVVAQQPNPKIVAKRIEAQEAFNHLRQRKSDYSRGYHFARPLPFDEFSNQPVNFGQQTA